MGRIGVKTIVWFEFVTTIILFIGLGAANLFKPGAGVNLSQLAKADITAISANTSVVFDWKTLVLHIIPTNIFDVLAKSDLLAVA
jgi:proton glutamate symport protein